MNDLQSNIGATLLADIEPLWDQEIIPKLAEYIKIPNKSPLFDKDWKANGHMDQAMQLLVDWVSQQDIAGMQYELVQLPERTPLLFIEIDGQCDDTVFMYGHMDKQPEMQGWDADLGPWQPVIKNDKLYGRGAADDGYALFSALSAIKIMQKQGIKHPRCVVIIEGCEESGSYDLPHYLTKLKDRIGSPKLIITLDSDAGNYEQLWLTTSLRGIVGGVLTVETQTEGVHSGIASGIMPSCFSVLRELLDRVEDSHSHEIKVNALHAGIPAARQQQNIDAARTLGDELLESQPLTAGTTAVHTDSGELKLNLSWRPTLTVTGIDGLPAIANAGNVRLPHAAAKLSFRLPPTINPETAAAALKQILENDPPHGAKVKFDVTDIGPGWEAPAEAQWLLDAGHKASEAVYNKPMMLSGGGGSIPFMGLLAEQYPDAQFFITGVLGPKSNAHGPNEFLHIPFTKKLTTCIAIVLAETFNNI